MHEIGLIKHVQLQRSSLKQGQRPQRYYHPAPLQVVERLLLASPGVSAVSVEGDLVIAHKHPFDALLGLPRRHCGGAENRPGVTVDALALVEEPLEPS